MGEGTRQNGRKGGPGRGRPRGSRGVARRAARVPAPPARPALPRRLAPRKDPTQERSRATVEAILGAAVATFASRGYPRTTTNEMARRAGISVGSLYQYFPNKDAILTALLDRHLQAVAATIRECVPLLADPAVPLRAGVRNLLARLLALHEADPRMARAVEEQVGQMPRVPAAFGHYEEVYRAELARILRARADVRRDDTELMAHLLFEVTETVSGWLAHGPADRFERETALDEAALLLSRYVERSPE